jgi:hypothetical protein
VDHIVLSSWANRYPDEFIRLHKLALDSDNTSTTLRYSTRGLVTGLCSFYFDAYCICTSGKPTHPTWINAIFRRFDWWRRCHKCHHDVWRFN